ncbi:polysaccharide pyruvyl transferase family protein [Shewanella psychromarinicola]|uniref:Polysaccharide pyruvyl transferase family protein n=1 Tax=Shewanella psychromarinicola TaxID=2487742 RepID=A0A3N4E7H4_9GAMM|nr:polysaccharide pyruvyl transferase family protein [Shewanella psychromarinicola]AZG35357.1 polysaccharide pyruvyl transferase family protein [Shewanella psychromarinicola]MCL1083609.1 polysaccharide pyruvyl transferase family protein [Shewanella psychromarinicola]RPA32838.1 polysaccharide pyruvyl transferase family protein [Shewanella psychromarinicola]
MKVAVITFPLINNYGGIIQAFAMMRLLEDLGHEPVLVNFQSESKLKSISKFIIKKYFLFFMSRFKNVTLTLKNKELAKFVDVYISPKTDPIYNSQDLKDYFRNNNFDACVVGSDQVFAKMGYTHFDNDYSLGFVKDDVIKLSYAASFGADRYQGDSQQIEFHKKNLNRFSGVSVREESGVNVCKETFSVDSIHVLDPTMMISSSYYLDIIAADKTELSNNNELFAYVLDSDEVKTNAIQKFAKNKKLSMRQINDGNASADVISMEKWIGSIYNAKHVITDSFHGCVFCIIFNKPFHCYINRKRGADRFFSLLKMFGLESRIIGDNISDEIIDWSTVNAKLEVNKSKSLAFLTIHLV